MIIVPITNTEVGTRQRKTMDRGKFQELKQKITDKGIIHPPVFWRDPITEKWVLTAGERRYKVMLEMDKENIPLRHDGELVPKGSIPITRLDDYISAIGRFEIEFDENHAREDLTWQDRVKALADLHNMRKTLDPKQTFTDTGKELIEKGVAKNSTMAGVSTEVSQATTIAEHLDNEKIANARNPQEAYALIYRQEEDKLLSALARRQLARLPTNIADSIKIREGDSLLLMPQMEADIVDLIVVDPPYGLQASGGGFRQRTIVHHNYEDTPEVAQNIGRAILTEGFRICKPRANIFMFCDIDLFMFLRTVAQNMGWTVFRRPLMWQKSQSEGLAPWGGSGPRITTEFIFYATKGRRGLHASPVDVFTVPRVEDRGHAAEKPVELLSKLISCATLPGDMIFDPCCGSGSTLVAAKQLKRQGIGIEKDHDYYNMAMANVFGK